MEGKQSNGTMDAAYSHVTEHNHRTMLVGRIWGKTERDWEVGSSGHAGHLTGRGDRLWRERWLNGSDVGRLQGTGEVGNIHTRGLVVPTVKYPSLRSDSESIFTPLH